MKEVWKPIDGFDGYDISNLGNVRCWNSQNGCSKKLETPRPLKLMKFANKNYYRVCLSGKYKRVHRLVAEAFIGPQPTPEHIVMHIDDNGLNNRVDNLKWGTHKENMEDMRNKNRQAKGEKIALSAITESQAKQIKAMLEKDKKYGRLRRIARTLGVSYGVVTNINYGKTWGHV